MIWEIIGYAQQSEITEEILLQKYPTLSEAFKMLRRESKNFKWNHLIVKQKDNAGTEISHWYFENGKLKDEYFI